MKHLILIVNLLFVFSLQNAFALEVATGHPVSDSASIQKSVVKVQELIKKGELLSAKNEYEKLLKQKLNTKLKKSIRKNLDELNIKILFSKIKTDKSIEYTVQSGDSLGKIAKRYNTTIELIKRSNGLKSSVIIPDQKLKINRGVFKIKVDKSENKLRLYQDDALIKTYRVCTGEKNSTPVGTFTIETKLEDPTWYKSPGVAIPPKTPENILGTRWMGFSLASYGIHGTTLPETIGTQASSGCIRMLNKDVEELYSIVPLKTKVTVRD
nr:ErfK/YbiS/YcfS/YnhG family protein [uncultured bacterium]